MVEIVAIFVACHISLLVCIDLPFIEKYHTFEDPDKCRSYVSTVVEHEQAFRIENKMPYPIVMGKCKYWLR